MADISPEARREYGARGARARLLGRTTLEARRELTAAATEARREMGRRRRTLADRIAEVEATLDTLPVEERHRQILLLEELRQSDVRVDELRRARERRTFDTLADELAS